MFFTQQQIEEIRARLALISKKDTDFPPADYITGEEVIAVIQEGINKKTTVNTLLKTLGYKFLEVSNETMQYLIEHGETDENTIYLIPEEE